MGEVTVQYEGRYALSQSNEWHELDERKSQILRIIIRDYVQTAEPVGSETLVQKYDLNVKPATVRNEMAAMSDLGYLRQPYTSAGRVPSDRGYRYYVERLSAPHPRALRMQRFVKRAPREGDSLPEVLSASLRLLSNATGAAAVATTARDETLQLARCVITPYNKERALLVCVFANGYVENKLFDLGGILNATQFEHLQNAVTRLYEGQTLATLQARARAPLPALPTPEENVALERIHKAIQSAAQDAARGDLFYEGALQIVEKPEFQRHIRLLENVLRALDNKKQVYDTLENSHPDELHVLIGEENPVEELQPCALVFMRYDSGPRRGGMIGVLGPTRMDYDHAMPTVQNVASALSKVLKEILES